MHKKAFSAAVLFALVMALCFSVSAFGAGFEIPIEFNGREIAFDNAPVIIDDVTLVEVRPIAEALGCTVKWSQNTQSVKLTKEDIGVVLKADYDVMTKTDMSGDGDGDLEQIQLPVAPYVDDDAIFVPLRDVAEAFGASIDWDEESGAVNIYSEGFKARNKARAEVSPKIDGHTFFFQNQAAWELPNYGSGYCWTCSYAMLISDVTGEVVTPLDVAEVNEDKCGSGSYCYHWDIADKFGVKFVSALDENSPYYGGRDSNSGGTKVNNPDEDENVTIEALKEAIDRNPAGVMVRYAAYPHTMVAVGYDDDTIYFNEPMQISRSEYLEESTKCNVPFEETCVAKRGINIAQLTFIQALAVE